MTKAARKADKKLAQLVPGQVLSFADKCPLPQLRGEKAMVLGVRNYRFGADLTISYTIEVTAGLVHLTVAEDSQGYYLALSREIYPSEQDGWFGRDALSFFTEASSAKTIRCKADLKIEGAWLADRYTKTVDWVSGSMAEGGAAGRAAREFHYNLLVNESGEKALEIEHDDASGENRIFVTVYRPVEDIDNVADVAVAPKPAPVQAQAKARPAAASVVEVPAQQPVNDNKANEEPPLFLENKARPDFRRLEPEELIHIPPTRSSTPVPVQETIPPLPSFLTSRENNYLSLDEVIPPETERLRCDLRSAKALIDVALARGVRVRDILREVVGLDSMISEEVMFELPLSDHDYRQLAMRYKLRPDHRDEIRRRMQEELMKSLLGVAKR